MGATDREVGNVAFFNKCRYTYFIVLLALSSAAVAQNELEVSVSPSPVGSGARAAGMANAFVAIADDATAASWNPAGLVQLERPEISFVTSYTGLRDYLESAPDEETDGTFWAQNYDLNYLSLAWPLPPRWLGGRNATVSLNYQRKFEFDRHIQLQQRLSFLGPLDSASRRLQTVDFKQDGGLSAISPAIAIALNYRLSVGVAANFWRDSPISDNAWTQDTRFRIGAYSTDLGGPRLFNLHRHEEYENLRGENFTFGILYDFGERWSVGARYDTALDADVDYTRTDFGVSGFSQTKDKQKFHLPPSAAIGVAYRRNDRLTLSFDITRTDWDKFYLENGMGVRRSAVDTHVLNPRTWAQAQNQVDFKPTYTVRLGAEYVFLPKQPRKSLNMLWSLRGGIFYDQEPASGAYKPGQRTTDDSGKPDPFWGGAFGVGLQLNQRVNLDFAYQLRTGNDVNRDFVRGIRGFKEDVMQHRVLLSTVIYF